MHKTFCMPGCLPAYINWNMLFENQVQKREKARGGSFKEIELSRLS